MRNFGMPLMLLSVGMLGVGCAEKPKDADEPAVEREGATPDTPEEPPVIDPPTTP